MSRHFCDLHTHSTFSDGTDTPETIIEKAEAIGLSAVALTDHNTVDGIPAFLAAARGRRVEAVAGIEFSAVHKEGGLHILGLGLEESRLDEVTAFLAPHRKAKEDSSRALVQALAAAGFPLDYNAIAKKTEGVPNRAHIATALVEAGCFPTVAAAFDGCLRRRHGFYTPPPRPAAEDCLLLLHEIGALAVIAHPFFDFNEDTLRRFVTSLPREARPDAMEAYYSEYSEEQTALSLRIAKELGLLAAGGSDYHGENKPWISLGRGCGGLFVPLSVWKRLKERLSARSGV